MSIRYPAGYAPRKEPHCGVLAVAIAAGVSFEDAWGTIKAQASYGASWRGRTYDADRSRALKALGASYVERFHVPARMIRGTCHAVAGGRYVERCTVATFARRHAKPGVTYLLTVGGHCVTLRDGIVADQHAVAPAAKHWAARKVIRLSQEITATKGAGQ